MANILLLILCVAFAISDGRLTARVRRNPRCGVNEQWTDCPTSCSEFCPTSEEDVWKESSCVTPKKCTEPACQCLFNQRRVANGTCVPTKQCPPLVCSRPNERFDPCPPLCPTDDCSDATPDGRCARPLYLLLVLPCTPTCRCIDGFWRNNGVCVPYEQCFKN